MRLLTLVPTFSPREKGRVNQDAHPLPQGEGRGEGPIAQSGNTMLSSRISCPPSCSTWTETASLSTATYLRITLRDVVLQLREVGRPVTATVVCDQDLQAFLGDRCRTTGLALSEVIEQRHRQPRTTGRAGLSFNLEKPVRQVLTEVARHHVAVCLPALLSRSMITGTRNSMRSTPRSIRGSRRSVPATGSPARPSSASISPRCTCSGE